tara:strand:+ start:2072 stop:2479 length:408 start_codon:yes stop_codon:yes gene_type:complete
MDNYQTRVLQAINQRDNVSLKNNVMVHNSYHTGNQFTSKLFVDYEHIATVYYAHDIDDLNFNSNGGTLTYNKFDHSKGDFVDAIRNDSWEIDEIVFNERAIDRCLGSNAVRYRNFLTRQFQENCKIVNEYYEVKA